MNIKKQTQNHQMNFKEHIKERKDNRNRLDKELSEMISI